MAKTIVKKSIKVEDILHSLNWQLANQHEHQRVIRAVDKMLEWHTKKEADFPINVYYTECLHNPTGVISNLEYIADRWKCVGRLMFLHAVMELY
jgi:hypothetical protein